MTLFRATVIVNGTSTEGIGMTPEAETFIQWKGTRVCMDFDCPCGTSSHVDADFAYNVRCPGCHSVYRLGWSVTATLTENPSGNIVEATEE